MPKIKQILANEQEITFILTEPVKTNLVVEVFSPSVDHEKITEYTVKVFGTRFSIARYYNSTDLLCCHFITEFEGAQYVTDIESKYSYPYPTITTKKGLRAIHLKNGCDTVPYNDALSLGSQHDSIDLDLTDLFNVYAVDDYTIPYEFNNFTYYVNSTKLSELDFFVKLATENNTILTITTLIYADVQDETLLPYARHPDYDGMGKVAMFNIVNEEGMAYYQAACNYLAERYTREDSKFGRITGIIVGNEASVQGAWCNAGDKTMQEFTRQYMTAMRVAWQLGKQYWSEWRVYASFDNHWNEAFIPQLDKKFYKGREMMEYMIDLSIEEGNFGWHIAHHPYTSNLINAAFWNDDAATFDYLTSPVISYKNLVLLQHFVKIPRNFYKGKPRIIILSEQGFNGANRTMEFTQALGYGKAYKAIMNMPEIESFIYHSQFDHPTEEHGLQLGIWRTETVGDYEQDARPIYNVIKYIDKPVKGQPDKKLYELF